MSDVHVYAEAAGLAIWWACTQVPMVPLHGRARHRFFLVCTAGAQCTETRRDRRDALREGCTAVLIAQGMCSSNRVIDPDAEAKVCHCQWQVVDKGVAGRRWAEGASHWHIRRVPPVG